MKNSLINNSKILLPFFVQLLFLGTVSTSSLFAQVHNNGLLHVGTNTVFVVQEGEFSFGSTSVSTTTKSAPYVVLDGKIMVLPDASFLTNGSTTKYVNGYAGTFATTQTLLAIGSSSIYAPIKVTASTNSGVQAAFFNTPPLTTYQGGLAFSVNAVANEEFWIVKGSNALLSLSYRASSNLNTVVTDIDNLTIVGYHAANANWEVIDSAVESGANIVEGNITSTNAIDLSLYEAFALGSKAVLSTTDFDTAVVTAFIADEKLNLTTSNAMKMIEIYDISGRLVMSLQGDNQMMVSKDFNQAAGVYIAKITFSDYTIASRKFINP